MASSTSIQQFREVAKRIDSLDVGKIVRADLGPLSFAQASDILANLKRKIGIANVFPDDLPQQAIDVFTASLNDIANNFQRMQGLQDTAFAQERQNCEKQIASQMDQIAQYWAPFVATAVEKSGIIEGSIAISQRMGDEATTLIDNIRKQASEYLETARTEAAKIKDRANLTAAGISVKAAQDQFNAAQKSLYTKAFIWSGLSILAFTGFFWFAFYLLRNPPALDQQISTQLLVAEVAYKAAIRITILTAIGAATTFLMKMARAHFHMAEYNEHRRRVANSMEAFVAAASTPNKGI